MPAHETIKPQRQPVHSDADFKHPSHPFALVVNVPLITFTPENGSTEIWLGTHNNTNIQDQEGAHGERASGRIKKTLLDARRAISPPLQAIIPKGSIVVRDLRLWHAGMPNYSQDIRVMLAFSKCFPTLCRDHADGNSPLCALVSQPDEVRVW
jgi:ectoine hydroxylase-related dioxygenase (phytanoyl-CoA dioxygenase family)